jgi:hypothetical protein
MLSWKYWRNRCARHCTHSTRQCLPPPLFVTQKDWRSEFQNPPIKSFTSKINLLLCRRYGPICYTKCGNIYSILKLKYKWILRSLKHARFFEHDGAATNTLRNFFLLVHFEIKSNITKNGNKNVNTLVM